MTEIKLTDAEAKKLLNEVMRPRSRSVPLDQDEIDLMNELLDRYAETFEPDESEKISVDEHRNYRLGFVYILSRNTKDFKVTEDWLNWIWTGKSEK